MYNLEMMFPILCQLQQEMFLTRKTLSTLSPALAKRFGSTLVIADHNNKALNAATLSSITAAKKFGSVHVLVAGSDCAAVATEASKAAGVDGVIVADKPALANFLPENLTSVLKEIITAGKYTHVVGATTSAIKNVIPRLAVAMNVSPITDVIAIKVPPAAAAETLSSRLCPPPAGRRHLRAPHLRGQRAFHREEHRRGQAHHHPPHKF